MLFFIILSLFLSINAQNLVFVSVVHRHGDRTPDYIYPTDPYGEDMWNGLGQLTPEGVRQLYSLGIYTKERYANFLPPSYIEGTIYTEASNLSRTVDSAKAFLHGLYDFKNIANGPVEPIHVIPTDDDNIIASTKPCPKMDQLKKEFFNNIPDGTKERYNEILKNLSEHVGEDVTLDNIERAFLIADTLRIEGLKGFVLPDWASDFLSPLEEMAMFFIYKLPFSTVESKRLYCGPLLKDILMHMQDARSGKNTVLLWEYSGHDTTVAKILSCLNVFDGKSPFYGAAVFIELYQNANMRYEVLVTYKTEDKVQASTIPGCPLFCPLHMLISLVKNVIPDDWDAECEA